MYTVKQVAALTGVAEATLRVWEKRYAVVEPDRSKGGYRLYDDHQVNTLRAMSSLVKNGVPASIAAETVRLSPPAGVPLDVGQGELLARPDLVAAALSLDPLRLDQVLVPEFARPDVERMIDDWLMPELVRLGDAWERGDASVAHEHFASAAIMRKLSAIFDQASPPPPDADDDGATPVLVGLPPGDYHELGSLCFAVCLRRLGVTVVYLGADVPLADWVLAASRLLTRVAVISVHRDADVPQAQHVINRLGQLHPPVSIFAGGRRCRRVRGAEGLPDSLSEAAATVHRALRSGRT